MILTIAGGDTIALQPNRDVDIQLAGQLRVVGSGESIAYELGEGENEGEERYNTLATPVGGEYQVVLSRSGTSVRGGGERGGSDGLRYAV